MSGVFAIFGRIFSALFSIFGRLLPFGGA